MRKGIKPFSQECGAIPNQDMRTDIDPGQGLAKPTKTKPQLFHRIFPSFLSIKLDGLTLGILCGILLEDKMTI